MSLLDRLERRYRRLAIPNVTIGIILGQVFLYAIDYLRINPGLLDRLVLYPDKVLDGEVWRLVTFLIAPPGTNILFALIFWNLFYFMGTALESNWGAFRYNVFLLTGAVATICGALIINQFIPGFPANNAFLYGTVFLAFAVYYPDFQLLVMFILPVKVRWLALFQWCIYGWQFVKGPGMIRIMVAASLLNFFLFFGKDIFRRVRSGQRRVVQQARQAKAKRTPRHVCRVCGVTNLDNPKMRFRYCSMCDGQCAYCEEHLADHEHVVEHTLQR